MANEKQRKPGRPAKFQAPARASLLLEEADRELLESVRGILAARTGKSVSLSEAVMACVRASSFATDLARLKAKP